MKPLVTRWTLAPWATSLAISRLELSPVEVIATLLPAKLDDAVIGVIVYPLDQAVMDVGGVAGGIFLVDIVKFASGREAVGKIVSLFL